MFIKSRSGILDIFFVLLIFAAVSCGDSQTTENTEQIAKDVEVSANVAAGAATTLAIGSGSATGTEIIIDDGALADGSTLSLDRVEQPSEFASFTSDNGDGESTFSKASSAIEVNGNSGGSSPSLASPMTIAIPYSGTTSLKLFLAGVAKTAENICVAHKNQSGELFFFRGKLLQIESSEEKIKFKSSTFGIYQLFFCGANTPTGFQDAGENGISGAPPGADPTTFSSYGSEVTYQLSIDSSTYAYDASKYCLLIASHDSVEASTGITVITAGEFTMNGGAMDLSLDVNTNEIGDEASLVIALLAQSGSHSCSFEQGASLDSSTAYNRSYRFKTSKKDLNEGTANGTFGAGTYALADNTIQIGTPASVNSSEQAFAVSQVCVSGIAKNSEGITLARMLLNTEIAGTSGETISVGVPSGMEGFTSIEFEVHMNNSCEKESFNYSDSYPLKLTKAHSDGIFYLAPISLSIPQTVQTSLAVVPNKNVCAELYHGTYTSSNTANSEPSKNLGLWTFTDSLSIYVPFGSEKMEGEVPIFDILFHLSSDCNTGFPSELPIIASNDENLFD